MINTTTLAQRDPRWARVLLGFNTDPHYSIGAYGCLLCAVSELAGVNPDVMNAALCQVGGYVNGGLMVFGRVDDACKLIKSPRIVTYQNQTGEYMYAPYPNVQLRTLQAELVKGPVLIEVDAQPGTGFSMHWVTCLDEHFTIDDPWHGDRAPLIPRYGPDLPTALVRAVYVHVEPNIIAWGSKT